MPKELLFNREYIERLRPSLRNDEIILHILGQISVPLPFNFIRELSGLPRGQVHRLLTTLENYKMIKKSTIARSTFYTIKKGEKNEFE